MWPATIRSHILRYNKTIIQEFVWFKLSPANLTQVYKNGDSRPVLRITPNVVAGGGGEWSMDAVFPDIVGQFPCQMLESTLYQAEAFQPEQPPAHRTAHGGHRRLGCGEAPNLRFLSMYPHFPLSVSSTRDATPSAENMWGKSILQRDYKGRPLIGRFIKAPHYTFRRSQVREGPSEEGYCIS